MSASGPGAPFDSEPRPVKVTAGLAHRGDDKLVVVLIVESPLFRAPVAVELSDEQAHRLKAQLAAALVEKPPPGAGVPGLAEYLAGHLHTDGQ